MNSWNSPISIRVCINYVGSFTNEESAMHSYDFRAGVLLFSCDFALGGNQRLRGVCRVYEFCTLANSPTSRNRRMSLPDMPMESSKEAVRSVPAYSECGQSDRDCAGGRSRHETVAKTGRGRLDNAGYFGMRRGSVAVQRNRAQSGASRVRSHLGVVWFPIQDHGRHRPRRVRPPRPRRSRYPRRRDRPPRKRTSGRSLDRPGSHGCCPGSAAVIAPRKPLPTIFTPSSHRSPGQPLTCPETVIARSGP